MHIDRIHVKHKAKEEDLPITSSDLPQGESLISIPTPSLEIWRDEIKSEIRSLKSTRDSWWYSEQRTEHLQALHAGRATVQEIESEIARRAAASLRRVVQKFGQAQNLQAARCLIKALGASWRIDEEAKHILLVNLDREGHMLGAWILPEGDQERAVKALLAEEGDYCLQTGVERLELQALASTLEGPEDEDYTRRNRR